MTSIKEATYNRFLKLHNLKKIHNLYVNFTLLKQIQSTTIYNILIPNIIQL